MPAPFSPAEGAAAFAERWSGIDVRTVMRAANAERHAPFCARASAPLRTRARDVVLSGVQLNAIGMDASRAFAPGGPLHAANVTAILERLQPLRSLLFPPISLPAFGDRVASAPKSGPYAENPSS
ncbi:hypothetical protein KFE25_006610 [Diacronema lutheri]|uniref:Uncharacterized protein n=1 Tax=Diacronema lutheri TaxID=2081491 RepID=A0A8J6C6Q6_DIALT|nr:hypothetical protein KFE25_006610 [Diacronema lutheri]